MKLTKNQTEQATLTDLYRAADKLRPVTLTYTKKDGTETVRTVELYDIRSTKNGDILLRGMDRQTGEARSFLVSGISAYTVHRGTYQIPRPVSETPAHPVPAFHTPSALIAYEIGRDERGGRQLIAA